MRPALTKEDIKSLAGQLGFGGVAFTDALLPTETGKRLSNFLELGFAGEMSWLCETRARRSSPDALWAEAKTAIVFAMSYAPDHDPLETLAHEDIGNISVYARNRDYHDVMKGRLKEIAQKVSSRNKCLVKVFVDTAPLMEKPLAQQAGLGWQGKHTNLVSRYLGSWFFLGAILTDYSFDADTTETDHCGNCRACLDICPTNAFPAPYQLDARRCISYLTIEHSAPIPLEYRSAMGNRIYGCDDCLAVCPWNKFAKAAKELKLIARKELREPDLKSLLGLDDAAFRKLFSGSPVKRIGRNRFIRNCLIAAGNSNNTKLVSSVKHHLDDPSGLVRGAAVWALSILLDREAFLKLKRSSLENEKDSAVVSEWAMIN